MRERHHPRVWLGLDPRLWLGLIVLLAVVVRASTLTTGLHMDDLAQRAMVTGGYPALRPWWDLYRFSGLGPEGNATLMNAGALPWWSAPELRLGAFRPIASALVWCDAKIGSTLLAHVHSMAWWAGLLVVGYRVVSRTVGHRCALVAVALYALDDCHIYPLSWLANRAAIISAVFGLLALEAHVRWREDGWQRGRWLGPALTAASVLAGEYAFSALGFLIAYVLVAERGLLAKRCIAVSGHLVVAGALLLVARGLGYGAAHSAVYLDPLHDFGGFAAASVERWPLLMADMLSAVPIVWLQALSPSVHPVCIFLSVAVPLAGFAALVWPGVDRAKRRWLAMWLVGAAIALVPVLASFVSARLTVVAALGTHVALAALVLAAVQSIGRGPRKARAVLVGAVAALVAAAHVVGGVYWGHRDTQILRRFNRAGDGLVRMLAVSDERAKRERWVLLSCTDPMTLIYPPILRRLQGGEPPRSWWVLSMAPFAHEMKRVSGRALEFTVRDGAMLSTPIEQFFRGPQDRFAEGDTVALDGLLIEIIETVEVEGEGAPRRVRFTFDRPLHDPSLRFMVLGGRGFVRYPIGAVGTTMQLPPGMNALTAGETATR